jgi:hypothetical protein
MVLVPTANENAEPRETGVRLAGFGIQGLGAPEEPAVQLNATELLYPFRAVMVPLKFAKVPRKAVSGVFETEI